MYVFKLLNTNNSFNVKSFLLDLENVDSEFDSIRLLNNL